MDNHHPVGCQAQGIDPRKSLCATLRCPTRRCCCCCWNRGSTFQQPNGLSSSPCTASRPSSHHSPASRKQSPPRELPARFLSQNCEGTRMLTSGVRHHPQASQRARDLERVYQSRRGHHAQISISDSNHHVTEAIGDMYGREDYPPQQQQSKQPRPLSFMPSPLGEQIDTNTSYFDNARTSSRTPLTRTTSNEQRRPPPFPNERRPMNMEGQPMQNGARSPSFGNGGSPPRMSNGNGPMSPQGVHRTPSETATAQFPLNDIDYESSAEAVAQELSNLQAIRRMSMDVNSMDPDLPGFGSNFGVPPVAPSHDDDEEDPSRLFWVPARLHPELAPKEFKTFIQDKVKTIKRSSLGSDSLSVESGSGGSLRRRKSMLSRQVEDGTGYQDGAERLERKRSSKDNADEELPVNLHDLEELVNDPSRLARKMSIDAVRSSSDSGIEVPSSEDMPILPPKPPGQTLKRSTRTTYRRGSLRKGERVPGSRRAMLRGGDHEDSASPSPISASDEVPQLPEIPDLSQFSLSRVQTEPTPQSQKPVENFSRPGRRARTPPVQQQGQTPEESAPPKQPSPPPIIIEDVSQQPPPQHFQSRLASNGRTTAALPGPTAPVPTIIETPPGPPEIPTHSHSYSQPLPQRSSSFDYQPSPPPTAPLPSRPQQRPPLTRPGSLQQPPQRQMLDRPLSEQPNQRRPATLDEMAQHPSPLPGHGSRTDSLSIIPTYTEEKDKKKPKDRKEEGPRKSSWGWFGSNSEEKERKEKEEKEAKRKAKLQKPATPTSEKPAHDTARLDVLQTSIDGPKGRESLVLDRASIQLDPEPERKNLQRKISGEKKEKESGLFSSLFGGNKKKSGEKEEKSKKGSSNRGLSPDPPPRILRPDVDYNWSRFSILEERAIYRMAHIKLANPRRELYSQVLLSNFMYSYLAKVQQMHPQMQIQTSPVPIQQKQTTGPQGTPPNKSQGTLGKKDQNEELSIYQRYQEVSARDHLLYLVVDCLTRSESNETLCATAGTNSMLIFWAMTC